MRTPLLPFLLLLSIPVLSQIPNGGFETWNTVGAYEDPDGWSTMNALTYPSGNVLSCAEGNPGAVGASFAKVTTHNIPGLSVVAGVIFAGTNAHPGFPYDQRPATLNGQWQFYMQGGDVGYMTVTLSKWNPGTSQQEPVGVGYTYMSGVMPAWQPFSIPITYASALDPDTAYIQIISSLGGATDGSTLWVDDLQFGAALGVVEQPAVPELQLQQSPACDQLTIITREQLLVVVVVDMSGRELCRQSPNGSATTVRIAHLPAGIYAACARFRDGRSTAREFVKY